jgi:DNA polymerase (family 10)
MPLTREEADVLINKLNDLNKSSTQFKIVIAGSYRREKESIKDLDILMVSKKLRWSEPIPIDLIKLPGDIVETNQGKIHRLTTIKFDILGRSKKITCDIYAVDRADLPFGLLHSTGGRDSNLGLRRIAISKGWLLNQYGLWQRDRPDVKVPGTENIKTEKEIYQKLGKPYKEPKDRL